MADARIAVPTQAGCDRFGRPTKGVARHLIGGAEQLREHHVDANRDLERRRVAPAGRQRLAQRRDPRVDLGHVAEPGRVPQVGVLHGQAQHSRPAPGDQDGRTRHAQPAREEHGVIGLVVAPVEVGSPLAEQRQDDVERLLEPTDPVVERDPERVELRLVPSGAEAQDEAPSADLVDGRRHLGQDRGIAERDCQDDGPDLHARCVGGEGREHRPALVDAGRGLARGSKEEVVVNPDRAQARALRHLGDLSQLRVAGGAPGQLALGNGHDRANLHPRMLPARACAIGLP